MKAINDILFQLNTIDGIIEKDKLNGFYNESYIIIEDECKFLDVNGLRIFITKNKVKNFVVLKNIVNVSFKIIDFIDNHVKNLERKSLNESISIQNVSGNNTLVANYEFYVLKFSKDNHCNNYDRISDKKILLEREDYRGLYLHNIKKICQEINYWILEAYPKLKGNDVKQYNKVINETNTKQNKNELMKSFELNFENLIAIGLTPEIFKNNFQEWFSQNKDIFIDVKNNLIYTGINTIKKDSAFVLSLLNKKFEANGMSKEEIEEDYNKTRIELKSKIYKTLDTLPEEQRTEFLLKALSELNGKLNESKEGLIKDEVNSFLGINDLQEQNTQVKSFFNNYSNKAKILLSQIVNDSIKIIDVIDYINDNTNDDTRGLLVNEVIDCFETMSNEFMLCVKEEDIKDALEVCKNNLEYIYINEEEYNKIKYFIRKINNIKTVYNVGGLSFLEKENSEQIIYLNNMMIDYHNGFFAKEIDGFENFAHFKSIYNYLNEKHNVSSKVVVENNKKNVISITENTNKKKKNKNYPAKFHALEYIIELLIKEEKPPQDFDGNFKKDEIIKIGIKKCANSGQNFYNFVKDHFELVSSKNIKYNVFGKNWKEAILELTDNKKEIEKYIENNNL